MNDTQSVAAGAVDLQRLVCTEYQLRDKFDEMELPQVTFHRMNSPSYAGEKWAVRQLSHCLNRDGEWEYQPQPSSRDDAFYARCRFDSLEQALATFDSANKKTGPDEPAKP
jgi:hypothetical protein